MSKLYFDKVMTADSAREVVKQIIDDGDFLPQDIQDIHFSKWWDNKAENIGAATLLGTYQGKQAVLKIQFVRPHTSEFAMISEFARQSKGYQIRPPQIFEKQQWEESGPYEMVVMEIAPPPVIPVDKKASDSDIQEFFGAFREYKRIAIRPFLQQPTLLVRDKIIESFHMWKTIRTQLDTQGTIESRQQKIIDEAVNYLYLSYGETKTSFCHGHFSARDVRKKGDEWILLSNLYWSFRAPLYDLVFGWHWRRLDLMGNVNLGSKTVLEEQPIWEKEMEIIVSEIGDEDNNYKKWYRLARLERAVAGLNLDILSLPAKLIEQRKWLAAEFEKEILIWCRGEGRSI